MSVPDLLAGLGTETCKCGLCDWAAEWLEAGYQGRPRRQYVAARLITAASLWVEQALLQAPGYISARLHWHVAGLHAQGAAALLAKGELHERHAEALRQLIHESAGFKRS